MLQPQDCRERFGRHLADETALLGELEQQLQHEHELLATNDIEGLAAASAARQQTVARLLRVNEERAGLCRARELAPDNQGFAALLAWCDPQGSLTDVQARCAVRAQCCREQNERNGALVTARLNRVGGMLGMIAGSNASSTYQPGAGMRAPGFAATGRMLSISA
jgi:flagellar biosynthesis/type III secretory pathway chaperone